jgi:biopolymer transport protein ExbB
MEPSFDPAFFREGGPLMWLLLLLSVVGFVIFFERTLFLHRGHIRSASFVDGIKNLLRKRRLVEALTVCEESPGPIPRVVRAALLSHDQEEARMRRNIQEAAMAEIPVLERRVGTLGVIARIAPILGLFGTLVAGLQSFEQLAVEGPYADAASYARHLAAALSTSTVGVAIAIMAFAAHHFLSGRVRALVHEMEWTGHHMMQFLLRDLPEETDEQRKGR